MDSRSEKMRKQTDELLLSCQKKVVTVYNSLEKKSDELMLALQTEIRYADSDRQDFLQQVVNHLGEVEKSRRFYRQKLSELEYRIRNVLNHK